MDTPHTLPASFGRALLELGRFFGQALYYRVTKRVMTAKQMVGVALITNAASQEVREVALALGETLKLFVPEPVDRNQPPLFAFGAAFFLESSTLFFSGERRGAFAWFGIAGELDERFLRLEESHIWHGDGARYQKELAQ